MTVRCTHRAVQTEPRVPNIDLSGLLTSSPGGYPKPPEAFPTSPDTHTPRWAKGQSQVLSSEDAYPDN
jgi:hypothetical protein